MVSLVRRVKEIGTLDQLVVTPVMPDERARNCSLRSLLFDSIAG
ncbi:MAG: hypothetical protein ACRENC_18170 [Gemmatimonadaceae bacterium]